MVQLSYDTKFPYPPERSCTYMITYNQLSLEDILQDCQEKFDDDKPAFLQMLRNKSPLMTSFLNPFITTTIRQLAGRAIIRFLPWFGPSSCRRFFPYPQTPCSSSWSAIHSISENSAAFIRSPMPRDLPVSSRISSMTFQAFLNLLLTLLNLYARRLILKKLLCQSLTRPVLKPMLRKIIPSTPKIIPFHLLYRLSIWKSSNAGFYPHFYSRLRTNIGSFAITYTHIKN